MGERSIDLPSPCRGANSDVACPAACHGIEPFSSRSPESVTIPPRLATRTRPDGGTRSRGGPAWAATFRLVLYNWPVSTRAENGGGELPPGGGDPDDTETGNVTRDVLVPVTASNDGPSAEPSRDPVGGGVVRRRATLRFEDGARPTGPALEVRTPTPAGFTPEPTRSSGATPSPTSESASILFDGQAAGYRLGRRLPGSDDVYHAVNPRFEGRLVIKLFRRARGLEPQVVEAFLSDTSRTSSLRHPHVVQVVDAGVLRDGTPFVVAEYLSGQTLEAALEEREGPITSGALALVRGMASALTAAHSVGVVHLELRPDNVFIAELAGYKVGFAKLMDFGVCHIDAAADAAAGARPRGEARRSGTHAAAGPWSRWSLAPEQWRTGTAVGDARTDQFGLAALAYRLMSPGRPPVGRTETGAVAGPVVLAPRVPALESVLARALAANPAERFDSVAGFFRAFEDSVSGATILTQLAPEPASVAPAMAPTPAVSFTPAPTVVPVGPRVLAAGPPSSGLAKTEEIVLATDDAVFPSGSGDARQPRRRTHKTGERTSLTQQFFAEGERQEATRFKNARFERQPSSTSLAFDSFDRVPRRRTPLWAGLFVAGALAIAGVVIWQGPRLRNSWAASELARRLGGLRASREPDRGTRALAPDEPPPGVAPVIPSPPAAPAESPPSPTTTEPVAGSAAVEAPAAPGPEPATAAATGPVAGAEPDPRVEATEAPAAPTTESRPAAEAAPTRSAPAEAPSPVRGARAPAMRRDPGDPAAEAGGANAPSASSRAGNPPAARNRPRPRSTALHGYIWSPRLQQMVPAQPAWPPPAESPPASAAPGPAPINPVGGPPPFDSTEPPPPAAPLPPASTVPESPGAGAPATAP